MRLCAGDELFAARKTGCGINMEQLWTWDACGVDDGTPHHLRSHVAMRGDMDNVTTCSGGGTKYPTRCCADPQAEMDAFHEETQPPLSEASCEQKGWGVDADLGVCGASQINKVCSGAVSLQDARAFCERLLQRHPDERPTAAEALAAVPKGPPPLRGDAPDEGLAEESGEWLKQGETGAGMPWYKHVVEDNYFLFCDRDAVAEACMRCQSLEAPPLPPCGIYSVPLPLAW